MATHHVPFRVALLLCRDRTIPVSQEYLLNSRVQSANLQQVCSPIRTPNGRIQPCKQTAEKGMFTCVCNFFPMVIPYLTYDHWIGHGRGSAAATVVALISAVDAELDCILITAASLHLPKLLLAVLPLLCCCGRCSSMHIITQNEVANSSYRCTGPANSQKLMLHHDLMCKLQKLASSR